MKIQDTIEDCEDDDAENGKREKTQIRGVWTIKVRR